MTTTHTAAIKTYQFDCGVTLDEAKMGRLRLAIRNYTRGIIKMSEMAVYLGLEFNITPLDAIRLYEEVSAHDTAAALAS